MKALLIIAHEMFRDEEYIYPKKILEDNGIETFTASWEGGAATGKLGASVNIDLTINEVDTSIYNAIIYVGGSGIKEHWNDSSAHRIAQEALAYGDKVLAAICSAAVILARSGVLRDKKATCFSGDAQELINEGVLYQKNAVVQDGLIITADGPDSAIEFGSMIARTLEQMKGEL